MSNAPASNDDRADTIVLAVVTLVTIAGLLFCALRPMPMDSVGLSAVAEQVDMRLNINTADAESLQALPGIGPALAAAIAAERETGGRFATVAELERVKGIGPAIRNRLEPYVVAE